MFKKFILAVAVMIAMAVPAMAADVPLLGSVTSPYSDGLNVQGDIHYIFSCNCSGAGIGTNIATIREVAEVRAVAVDPNEEGIKSKVGVGVGANLPAIINNLGGSWLMDKLNPSIGISVLTDLDGPVKLDGSIYVTAVDVKF